MKLVLRDWRNGVEVLNLEITSEELFALGLSTDIINVIQGALDQSSASRRGIERLDQR